MNEVKLFLLASLCLTTLPDFHGQIDRQHAGEHIDGALLNNVLAIYVEIGDGSRRSHAKGFEQLLQGNAAFYFDGASSWIASYSFKDYKPKVISVLIYFILKLVYNYMNSLLN